MMDITDVFDKFMAGEVRNAWIEDDALRVYIRKGNRYINRKHVQTIDVANIMSNPKHQGKGFFKAFMQYVESYNMPVYVENIFNPALTDMLIKNGYEKIGPAEPMMASVVKMPQTNNS
jgi:hypothetical protein